MGGPLCCGVADKRRGDANKGGGPQVKPKVANINRLKTYGGEESFVWFMGKESTASGPSQNLNIDKSTLPGVTTTPKKDGGGKGRNSGPRLNRCVAVTEIGNSPKDIHREIVQRGPRNLGEGDVVNI